jgi:exodeoxyribonuclease V alpha subunit
MSQTAQLLTHLDLMADSGKIRRLGAAFARFMATLGVDAPPLLLACALLSELEGAGHSCLSLEALARDPCALLAWPEAQWQQLQQAAGPLPQDGAAWRRCLAASPCVLESGQGEERSQPLVLDLQRLYLRRYWRGEVSIAQAMLSRARQARVPDLKRARHWLDLLFAPDATHAPNWQKIACASALQSHVAVVTGGPGTGKTHTVARLLALLFALADDPARLRVALAAPTGKAAARLKQSIDNALTQLAGQLGPDLPLAQLTGRMGAARTLHSLLGARPDSRQLRHNAANPLDIDVLIVDEASMVHLEMMASLLDALPASATLILLGDKDQLASVEAGAVLGDLCREAQNGGYDARTAEYVRQVCGETLPPQYCGDLGALAQQTVMLRHSYRFDGPIGELATAINQGDAAAASLCLHRGQDQILQWLSPSSAQDILPLALYGRPAAAGAADGHAAYLRIIRAGDGGDHPRWVREVLRSFDQFRLLCALRDGEWGVRGLNQAIEQRLLEDGLIERQGEWYVGRPVMVTRNDPGLGVFNGDIGIALPEPDAERRAGGLRVYFSEGDQVRAVLSSRLRDVETAYAMTVHKSQGSEFGHTVLVLPPAPTPVLSRELVYTGITRARQRFTLVSSDRSLLELAIRQPTLRASGLWERLQQ